MGSQQVRLGLLQSVGIATRSLSSTPNGCSLPPPIAPQEQTFEVDRSAVADDLHERG